MYTFNEIIEAVKNKGLQFDTYTSFLDRWGENEIPITTLSIKLEKDIWYHWDVLPEYAEKSTMNFKCRYNQTNGATQKSFKKEFKAYRLLNLK